MSSLRTPQKRHYKLALSTGAIAVVAAYLIFKTYPHLQTSVFSWLSGSSTDSSTDDHGPIELNNVEDTESSDYEDNEGEDASDYDDEDEEAAYPDESIVKVENWTDDNLKSWLSEVRITRKECKSPLQLLTFSKMSHHRQILLILTSFPSLTLLKRLLSVANIDIAVNLTNFVFAVLLYVRNMIRV